MTATSLPTESALRDRLRRVIDPEAGLNIVDTAPSYEEGFSEEIVGAALAGRPREGLFVIDKVDVLFGLGFFNVVFFFL